MPTERERTFGYRAHFERAGHAGELAELDEIRRGGGGIDDLVAAASDDFLLSSGYYGPAEGARAAFLELAEGLDTAIVRIVGARRGIEAARAVMQACAPA